MKEFLSRQGTAFEERNIAEDPRHLEQLHGLGFTGTPVVVAGTRVIQGYRPDELASLLRAPR